MATQRSTGWRSSRRVFFALIMSTLVLLSSTAAAENGEGSVDIDGSSAIVSVAWSQGPITTGPGAGHGGTRPWPYSCIWYEIAAPDDPTASRVLDLVAGHIYALSCLATADSGLDDITIVTVYDPADPVPGFPTVTSLQLRDIARDIAIVPPLPIGISPNGRQITGVETWLWPDGAIETVSAFASVPGGLSVTVEGRYRETVYDLGEEGVDPLICTEKLAWQKLLEATSCGHTYYSEAEARTIAAVSRWDYVWWDNAAQPTPVLIETIEIPELVEVQVIDLEAVISNPRSG